MSDTANLVWTGRDGQAVRLGSMDLHRVCHCLRFLDWLPGWRTEWLAPIEAELVRRGCVRPPGRRVVLGVTAVAESRRRRSATQAVYLYAWTPQKPAIDPFGPERFRRPRPDQPGPTRTDYRGWQVVTLRHPEAVTFVRAVCTAADPAFQAAVFADWLEEHADVPGLKKLPERYHQSLLTALRGD